MRSRPCAARHARVILAASLLGGALAPATLSAAAPTPSASTSVRAIEELRQAPGVEKYGALRFVWRQWDQTDPATIEEAIVEVADDKALAPPVRAYAQIMAGYARRRRGDLDGARAKIRAAGVVDKWIVLGPFDNEGKEGLEHAFAPEKEFGEEVLRMLMKRWPRSKQAKDAKSKLKSQGLEQKARK